MRLGSVKVEQFRQEAFAPLLFVFLLIIVPIVIVATAFLVLGWLILGLRCWRGGCCGCFGRTTLDDFVQFSSVQPDTTALGAIIDLDPTPFGHQQFGTVNGTSHLSSPFIFPPLKMASMKTETSQTAHISGSLLTAVVFGAAIVNGEPSPALLRRAAAPPRLWTFGRLGGFPTSSCRGIGAKPRRWRNTSPENVMPRFILRQRLRTRLKTCCSPHAWPMVLLFLSRIGITCRVSFWSPDLSMQRGEASARMSLFRLSYANCRQPCVSCQRSWFTLYDWCQVGSLRLGYQRGSSR